ncbi:hypothetical protein WDW89_03725 [Deltaproteobacteria bacterium TL4]
MRRIVLFAEDYGHEEVIKALVERIAHEYDIPFKLNPLSVRGGHGTVIKECKTYLRDLHREKTELPDLLIIATDANCKGFVERRNEIDKINELFKERTLYAIPDPHVERWVLLDSTAFKTVLGKGCEAPDYKCERGRYKQLLLEAMRQAGVVPPLGGLEYAKELIDAMDLKRIEQFNDSFGKFVKDLNHKFKEWKNS